MLITSRMKRVVDFIKRFEGFSPTAYVCPGGKWTIGYGTVLPGPTSRVVTREEAEGMLMDEVLKVRAGVLALVDIDGSRLDALVSFAYNLGLGALGRSTLLRKVRANPSDPSIRNEFRRWVFAGGVRLKGLAVRRDAEADMYFSDDFCNK